MISYLAGNVIDRGENWLIIETGGVGYKVFVPADTLFAANANEKLTLYCHHHFTQDSQSLYGFPRKRDLELFELIIAVSGIGPKSALSILSRAKSEEVEQAILTGDATLFTAISGVGKKKADHIIVELRPRLTGRQTGDLAKAGSDTRNVLSALEGLGYKRDEIAAVLKDMPGNLATDADRIKWALRHLYR
jgi:Holliday junction DNA helicase RuvA